MDQFKFVKTLGKGNYGQVDLFFRYEDNKSYAVKSILTTSMSKSDRESELEEIRVLGSVFHPNVLPLYEAFIEFGKLHMVLEYCERGDLNAQIRQHIISHTPFTEDRVWEVMLQSLAGLRALHDLNVAHRDVKPQNLLMVDDRVIKIGDLGFSAVLKSSQLSESLGTPYYIAPEVWRSSPYGCACDIFSLGVIIYYMMALRHPFEARDVTALKRECLSGVYKPLPATYSADLRDLVGQMLISDQYRRPSAAELLRLPACQKRQEISPTSLYQQILPDVLVQEAQFGAKFVPELGKTIPNDQAMQNAMRGCANIAVRERQYERLAGLREMAKYESAHRDVYELELIAQNDNSTPEKPQIEAEGTEEQQTLVPPQYCEIQRMEAALEETARQQSGPTQFPAVQYPRMAPNYPSSKGQPLKRFW